MATWVRTTAIQSDSKPGLYYQVGITDKGQYGCSCPHWKFRRAECKHIRQVKLMDGLAVDKLVTTPEGMVVTPGQLDRQLNRDEKKIARRLGRTQVRDVATYQPAPQPVATVPAGRPKRMVLLDEPTELL